MKYSKPTEQPTPLGAYLKSLPPPILTEAEVTLLADIDADRDDVAGEKLLRLTGTGRNEIYWLAGRLDVDVLTLFKLRRLARKAQATGVRIA